MWKISIETADAATQTWDFNVQGDYTRSSGTGLTVSGSIMQLEKSVLTHTGVIANATNHNGAYDVVVDGIYAYMTNFDGDRVSIINISNPAAPTLTSQIINNAGTIRLDGAAGIVKDGNFLYVASNVSNAMQIINVTNPALPVPSGQVFNATNLSGARWIAKSGNYVYVANNTRDSVEVIDVTNPAAPAAVGRIRNTVTLNGARDIKIVWNTAYVAVFDGDRLTTINITNPAAPVILWNVTNATTLNGAHNLEISGNYAYVSANQNASVAVVNISTPATPTITTSISGWNYSLNTARDLLVDGKYLFMTGLWNDAVNIADISNPATPTFVNKVVHNAANPLLDGVGGLYKVWDLVYAASSISDALEILRHSYDTTSPFVTPITAFNYGADDIVNITEVLWAGNQGSVSYQISKNGGTTWYYWNGTAWAITALWVTNSNPMSTINTNLTSFNALAGGTGNFSFKAFFTSNGAQKVELDSLTVDTISPPSPGGVSGGLSLWLKANQGTSTTTNGTTLATWNDQSLVGLNATAVTAPIYRDNTSDNLNFYPVVDFDGTTQYMQNLNNGAHSDSYFMVIVPNTTIDGTVAGKVPFGFDCLSGVLSSGTCGLWFAGMTLGAFTVALPDEVLTHAIGSSTNWRSSQTGLASYAASKPMLLWANENATGNGTDIYEKGVKIDNTTMNTYQTLSTADYSLGRSLDAANPFWYNGKIAEVINFSGRVSDTDRSKIESYLAFKYGMTLSWGTQNYVASDGTTLMWSSSLAGSYNNAIFGIGRDINQELAQPQAKSVNNDGIITLQALAEGTNTTPSFVDITDKEFLSLSDNLGANTWTAVNSPAGYNKLVREWRVQEIGDIGTVQLDFDVADTDFNVPNLNAGTQYFFLYDTNNNNSLADDTPTAMTNPSGNIWRISGINPAHLREFTIATQASTNNIPTNITLSSTSINENVAVNTTIGTLSTTDADVLDTHTYTLVSGFGDTDNVSFSIVGNALRIQEIPDFEIQDSYSVRIMTDDGNGGQYQKAFTVTINDLGEALTSILDFETPGKYDVTSGSWSRTLTNPYEGSYSLESNNAGAANSQSCFEVNHTLTSTGGVDFYYNVSSQAGGDFLQFYIDNVQQGTGWSGTVPWAQYISPDIAPGTHAYKWCYIKDAATNAGTDNAFIDYITFPNRAGDIISPNITGTNYASGVLLPGGNHNLIFSHNDAGSGIDTSSANIELYKWDGVSSWGSNIASGNIGTGTVNSSGSSFPTLGLNYGKYRYEYFIEDIAGNISSTGSVFYIDEPEFIIGSGSIDMWAVDSFTQNFSQNVVITVKTVGAWFNLILNENLPLMNDTESINSWDGSIWYGFDQSPFSGNISTIFGNQIIATQSWSININGNKNTYTYNIKIWALVDINQIAGNYSWTLDFDIDLNY